MSSSTDQSGPSPFGVWPFWTPLTLLPAMTLAAVDLAQILPALAAGFVPTTVLQSPDPTGALYLQDLGFRISPMDQAILRRRAAAASAPTPVAAAAAPGGGADDGPGPTRPDRPAADDLRDAAIAGAPRRRKRPATRRPPLSVVRA